MNVEAEMAPRPMDDDGGPLDFVETDQLILELARRSRALIVAMLPANHTADDGFSALQLYFNPVEDPGHVISLYNALGSLMPVHLGMLEERGRDRDRRF